MASMIMNFRVNFFVAMNKKRFTSIDLIQCTTYIGQMFKIIDSFLQGRLMIE